MDGQRFDAWTRRLSYQTSRRTMLHAFAAAGAFVGLIHNSPAKAGPGCRDDGHPCGEAGACCSGYCGPPEKGNVRRCAPCSGVGCGEICCPPETVACTTFDLPDGSVTVGCLCIDGMKWEPVSNTCVPCPIDCVADDECCEGMCCDGVCCTCREPGISCTFDAECCGEIVNGDQPTGRCIDGVCRCCAQGSILFTLDPPIEFTPGPEICCEWPNWLVACCSPTPSCDFYCCTAGLDCVDGDPEFPLTCPRGTEFNGGFANDSCWRGG